MLGWGAVLNSIIVLLATAAVIFYLVRGLRLDKLDKVDRVCLLYTSPSPRDRTRSRMPSSA